MKSYTQSNSDQIPRQQRQICYAEINLQATILNKRFDVVLEDRIHRDSIFHTIDLSFRLSQENNIKTRKENNK